ncbi:UDP-N-acetylmuramate dehydrogenase [Thalassospiraceae bacterium LMO-SO8]|nr:UDP-N-acetylmuramate dehydrogenase [Alphaproteobacteria bacterium LMO-S08]WND74789.1 UDP-N-acetylmuramate dehydrogenase [Thalassospiraceae bacterium LMO-SO8]
MMAARYDTTLFDRLPPVRGRLTANAALAGFSWFRVGGPAEVLFEPADTDDLAAFMANLPAGVPVTVIGVASNLLVRDGGVAGVVIRLGKAFADISIDGDTVTAGAGAMDVNVARAARDAGLAGLEFLIGIPGTVGGALRMNAGAYGAEVSDIFAAAWAVTGRGEVAALSPADMAFAYRHCGQPEDVIFTRATFRATPGDVDAISQRMAEIQKARGDTQPVKSRTGGSTFANPSSGGKGGHKAWELIDEAGCRGLTRGGAQVSPQHCNFLINTGNATAADLEGLGEEVRRRVLEETGVELHWEIRRIGVPSLPKAREVTP